MSRLVPRTGGECGLLAAAPGSGAWHPCAESTQAESEAGPTCPSVPPSAPQPPEALPVREPELVPRSAGQAHRPGQENTSLQTHLELEAGRA